MNYNDLQAIKYKKNININHKKLKMFSRFISYNKIQYKLVYILY